MIFVSGLRAILFIMFNEIFMSFSSSSCSFGKSESLEINSSRIGMKPMESLSINKIKHMLKIANIKSNFNKYTIAN